MKKFVAVFIGLWLFAAIIMATHGGFKTVSVETVNAGPFELLYMDHKGPYRDTGKIIGDVNTLLRDNSVPKLALAGLYFDKPSEVAEENLRSQAGAVVDEKGLAAAAGLLKEGKVKHRTIKSGEFAHTTFPFKNMLSMLFAIRKVYPALEEYSKENNIPQYTYKEKGFENGYIMELYRQNITEFYMPTGN